MKILVLAPHPFYQERGTPIAVDMLVRSLCDRGDEVEVLTFHEGQDRDYAGLKIHRIKPWLPIGNVRPGFSFKKLVCDAHLFARFVLMMMKRRYDIVHAIEESAFMAMLVCPLRGVPYIYDMDSNMTTQIVDGNALLRPLRPLLSFMESLPVRFADVVVPMCDALADDAARHHPNRIVVLKDVSLLMASAHDPSTEDLRETLNLEAPHTLSMYIGNLEPYQGIELMLRSFEIVASHRPEAHLAIIGGMPSDIAQYRHTAGMLSCADRIHFLGRKPVDQIGQYMAQADVLVSPRTKGHNTPMKIYSYLDSGTAVLATALPTHTQVVNEGIAVLAPPEPGPFADSWLDLLSSSEKRARLASHARAYIQREHSYEIFKARLFNLYRSLEPQPSPGGANQ